MKLTVQHQHNATSFTCQLQPPGGTIGRGEQNDLNLEDTSGEMSTLQAILRIDETRADATILNMSSMGRVSVNDTPLGLSQERTVDDGDRICIGDYLITVENQAASAVTSGAPSATDATASSVGSTSPAGASAGFAAAAGASAQSHSASATAGSSASVAPAVPAGSTGATSSTDPGGSASKVDDSALSATPYDTAAFTGGTAGAPEFAAASPPADLGNTAASANTEDPAQLPTWHPAYQPPGQPASPSGDQDHPLGSSSANYSTTATPATSADAASDTASQSDPYPDEHPLGTPINRMPPPAAVPNTTVAPMPGSVPAPQPAQENLESSAPEQTPPAAPSAEENPDDIFKDLLSGPGVLPVGGASADDRHPFEMESATNRNHHNPVELLKPEGLHHPSIDGDPLDSLPSDGAEKDRQTIFSDDSPTTLNKDTALDSHKEDNILETLRRAAHSEYKDRKPDPDKGDR